MSGSHPHLAHKAERTNSSLGFANLSELNNTATLRTRAFVQDLRQLDRPCRLEQLDQIFVRGGPRQLHRESDEADAKDNCCTHVANHDLLRRLSFEPAATAAAVGRTAVGPIAAIAATHTHPSLLVRTRVVRVEVLAEGPPARTPA